MRCPKCHRQYPDEFFHHSINFGLLCFYCWDRLTELKDEAKRDEWDDKRGREED